jgi:hypothetical protein
MGVAGVFIRNRDVVNPKDFLMKYHDDLEYFKTKYTEM